MKKNGNYVGVDEKFIPEDEKYVDESSEVSNTERKKMTKAIISGQMIFVVAIFIVVIVMFAAIVIKMFAR